MSPNRTVAFAALCRARPLRARCTTAKTGRNMYLHEHDDPLRAARADWDTDRALREDCHLHRPNAERTASQIATQGGQRIKLRYHGTVKNNAWLKYGTAAVNLRKLVAGVTSSPRGRQAGSDAGRELGHRQLDRDQGDRQDEGGQRHRAMAKEDRIVCASDGVPVRLCQTNR